MVPLMEKKVKPKKHLGQHFLTDQAIARRITNLLKLEDTDTIIEVGPGMGILTRYLAEKNNFDFIAIEKDRESVEYLRNNLSDSGKDKVIEGDFLLESLEKFGNRIAIIGNFPYNISSQIFFKILENRNIVREAVCMIQREVAERLISPPGSKRYGILSVLLQAWYTVNTRFHVSPGSFYPAPEVRSTVIRLERNERKDLGCDEKLFIKIVKASFNKRRKMMRNSLKDLINFDPGEYSVFRKRPEELSIEEFINLTNIFSKFDK